MIWLASFPRSGNTFCRNLFYDVYGLESTSYPMEGNSDDSKKYRVTKTHVRLKNIKEIKEDDFVIYLVRDGRDAITSNAHYRKNFIEPKSKLDDTIEHGIVAPLNSHFGGWSSNLQSWIDRADLIVRFEDLIENPIRFLKELEAKVNLPNPDYSKIKTFSQLKHGAPRYGSGGRKNEGNLHSKAFFNKGKVGQWKEAFSSKHKALYWLFHGDEMESLGYKVNGEILPFDKYESLSCKDDSRRILMLKKYHEVRILLGSGVRKLLRRLT